MEKSEIVRVESQFKVTILYCHYCEQLELNPSKDPLKGHIECTSKLSAPGLIFIY